MFWVGALLFASAPTVGHLSETAYGASIALFGIIVMLANVKFE